MEQSPSPGSQEGTLDRRGTLNSPFFFFNFFKCTEFSILILYICHFYLSTVPDSFQSANLFDNFPLIFFIFCSIGWCEGSRISGEVRSQEMVIYSERTQRTDWQTMQVLTQTLRLENSCIKHDWSRCVTWLREEYSGEKKDKSKSALRR